MIYVRKTTHPYYPQKLTTEGTSVYRMKVSGASGRTRGPSTCGVALDAKRADSSMSREALPPGSSGRRARGRRSAAAPHADAVFSQDELLLFSPV